MFLLILQAASTRPSLADVVHLRDGTNFQAESCRDAGDQFLCRRAGGLFGFDKAQVEKIDTGGGTRMRPSPGRSPAATRSGAPGADSDPPSEVAPAIPSSAGGDPNGWRARLQAIEGDLLEPGAPESQLRQEAAILSTLLGNEAYRSGDLDAAEAGYLRARDFHPELTAPILNLARLRMTQGRDDDAARLGEEALAMQPDDHAALALLGIVAYRRDRIGEAIELWERSLAIRQDDAVSGRLAKARKELEVEQDFYRSGAAHFTLKYDGNKASESLSNEILDHLEATYGDLTSRFIVFPESVIIVTLYSREAFHDVTESPRWVGGLFDGQIRIPIGGLTRLTEASRDVFTHELTHCIVYHKTRGAAPRWLQEGIAQLMEGRSALRLEAELAGKHGGLTPQQLAETFSYPLSLSLVEHFLERWSFSHLLDLLSALGAGSDIEAAFISAIGEGYEYFLGSWLEENGGRPR